MEKKTKKTTVSIRTYNKLKKDYEKLTNQLKETETKLDKTKIVTFYLTRLHRVAPEGIRLKKSKKEIDDMTLKTVDYMVENVSKDVVDDYRKSTLRVLINKISKR